MKTDANAIPVQMQDITRTELARMERQVKDKGSAAYISDQLQRAAKDDVLGRTLPLMEGQMGLTSGARGNKSVIARNMHAKPSEMSMYTCGRKRRDNDKGRISRNRVLCGLAASTPECWPDTDAVNHALLVLGCKCLCFTTWNAESNRRNFVISGYFDWGRDAVMREEKRDRVEELDNILHYFGMPGILKPEAGRRSDQPLPMEFLKRMEQKLEAADADGLLGEVDLRYLRREYMQRYMTAHGMTKDEFFDYMSEGGYDVAVQFFTKARYPSSRETSLEFAQRMKLSFRDACMLLMEADMPLLYPRDVEDDPIIARLLENDFTRIA